MHQEQEKSRHDLNLFLWKQHSSYCGHTLWFFLKKPSIHDFKERFTRVWFFISLRKNQPQVRVTSGQKLCTEIIYVVLQTSVPSSQMKSFLLNNTKCRKQILKFIWKYCRNYCSNETDDEILPVFAQFLWTLKFIFSSSHRKLYLVLSQTTVYIFSFQKMQKDCNILKVTMVPGFVH